MKINVAAYSEQFRAQSKELNQTFRKQVREQYGRELSKVEEAQTRTTEIQLAATLFIMSELDLDTAAEDVVQAYGIACAVGLGNICDQFGIIGADAANMFGRFFITALKLGEAGKGIEAEISPEPFVQN